MTVWMVARELPPYHYGGLGTHIGSLVDGLIRRGVGVKIVYIAYGIRGFMRRFQYRGVPVYPVPFMYENRDGASGESPSMIARTKLLLRWVAKIIGVDDIIHAHEWFGYCAGAFLKDCSGAKLVTTVHLLQHEDTGRVIADAGEFKKDEKQFAIQSETAISEKSDAVIFVSTYLRQYYGAHYRGDCNGYVVPNCLNLGLYAEIEKARPHRQEIRSGMGISASDVLVVGMGRLQKQKGFFEFLSSAKMYLENRKIRIIIAGRGDEAEFLRSAFDDGQGIRVVEFLNVPDQARLLCAADIGIFPSLYEPFGLVLLDFAIAALPVVAADVGGVPEIVRSGNTGILVPMQNTTKNRNLDGQTFIAAIEALAISEELRREMGAAACSRAFSEFSASAFIQKTADVYRSVCPSFRIGDARTELASAYSFRRLFQFAVTGLMTYDELSTLYYLAKTAAGDILEIGSFYGKSAMFMATAIMESGRPSRVLCVDPAQKMFMATAIMESGRPSRVLCVDPAQKWSGKNDPEVEKMSDEQYRDHVRTVFSSVMQAAKLSNVSLLQDRSVNVLPVAAEQGWKFAMAFIDGDHDYDAVKADFLAVLKVVPPGGIIVLHDCGPRALERDGIDGPERVLEECVIDNDHFGTVHRDGTLAWFKVKFSEYWSHL